MKTLTNCFSKAMIFGSLLFFSSLAYSYKTYRTAIFEITVTNVTADNVISPFLAVAHDQDLSLFTPTKEASPGVAAIAETGDTSVLQSELEGMDGIMSMGKPDGGPIFAANSATIKIEVPYTLKKQPVLTLLAMIGRSNDSFIALRNLPLNQFKYPNAQKTFFATNYDAGSEENTGDVEDFGSGGHPIENAEGFISLDRGLNPRGNAPDIFAWGPKAASVTIKRIK